MGLCEDYRILIKSYQFKVYGSKRLMKELPINRCNKNTVNDFLNI